MTRPGQTSLLWPPHRPREVPIGSWSYTGRVPAVNAAVKQPEGRGSSSRNRSKRHIFLPDFADFPPRHHLGLVPQNPLFIFQSALGTKIGRSRCRSAVGDSR